VLQRVLGGTWKRLRRAGKLRLSQDLEKKIPMTTAYTQIIEENPHVTFKDFALRCAYAVGYLGYDRGLDSNPTIPEPEPIYAKNVIEIRAELAALGRMTVAEADRCAEASYKKALERHETWKREAAEKNARYARILADVEAWAPPTDDHTRLKAFMIEQIALDYRPHEPDTFDQWKPNRLTGPEWREQQLAMYRRQQGPAQEALARAEKFYEEGKVWLQALRQSLG